MLVNDTALVHTDSRLKRLLERRLVVLVQIVHWLVDVGCRRWLLSGWDLESIERSAETKSGHSGNLRLD